MGKAALIISSLTKPENPDQSLPGLVARVVLVLVTGLGLGVVIIRVRVRGTVRSTVRGRGRFRV